MTRHCLDLHKNQIPSLSNVKITRGTEIYKSSLITDMQFTFISLVTCMVVLQLRHKTELNISTETLNFSTVALFPYQIINYCYVKNLVHA